MSGATPYVAHRYSGGDACELTGQARSVEVRFTCGHGAADTLLTSVREPASCTYVVTIATPRLCKHPGFQAAPREPALIQCHMVPEEEAAAAQCGGGGGGGEEAATAAAAAAAAVAGEYEAADAVDEVLAAEDDAYGDVNALGDPYGGAGGEGDTPYAGLEPEAEEDDPYADPLHEEL